MPQLLPIERFSRWLHARREFERTHCANADCRKPIPEGQGFCSNQCIIDDQESRTM